MEPPKNLNIGVDFWASRRISCPGHRDEGQMDMDLIRTIVAAAVSDWDDPTWDESAEGIGLSTKLELTLLDNGTVEIRDVINGTTLVATTPDELRLLLASSA